jgi:hypothetical protein
MKNIIFTITLFVLFSCDPTFHDDYIIVNKCDKTITVNVTFNNGNNKQFEIQPSSEYLFYSDEWVGGKSRIEEIDMLFKTIVIIKENSSSLINYANHKLWEKQNVDGTCRSNYCTDVKYYLYIYSKDFEDE